MTIDEKKEYLEEMIKSTKQDIEDLQANLESLQEELDSILIVKENFSNNPDK